MKKININLLVGVLCAAGLFFLFSKWGSRVIFENKPVVEVDGEEVLAQSYVIETGGGSGSTEPAAVLPAVFLAQADAANGEKIFKKCASCHKLDANGTGPALGQIYGAKSGSSAGFSYSEAMAQIGLTWDAETLFKYLGDVKGTVPGNKMSFPGLAKEQDRADLIAYLAGDKFDAAAFKAQAEAGASGAEASGDEATDTQPAATEEGAATTEAPAGDEVTAGESDSATSDESGASEASTESSEGGVTTEEAPATEEPVTEEPAAEEPVTEEPATEEPVTEEPAAEVPAETSTETSATNS